MNDNIRAVCLTAIMVLVSLILLIATGFGVSYWIQIHYGHDAVAFFWISIVLLLVLFLAWWMNQRSTRMAFDAIIDFQAADDRGEVARARVLQEVVRATGHTERAAVNMGTTVFKELQREQRQLTNNSKIASALPWESSFETHDNDSEFIVVQ